MKDIVRFILAWVVFPISILAIPMFILLDYVTDSSQTPEMCRAWFNWATMGLWCNG